MKAIFVTGTDTGVGKTIVCAHLAKYILEKGYSVITQKWVETGCRNRFSRDVETHLKIMGKNKLSIRNYLSDVSPYTFKEASSPHLASKMENKKINADKIKNSFRLLTRKFDFVIVEGIGGCLVPFDKSNFVINIVKDLNLPVVVVAHNKLGAINHTLLTLEALSARGINILGVLFNNSPQAQKMIIKDNPRIIKTLSKQEIFGCLPWVDKHDKFYESFSLIAGKIWEKMLHE